MCKFCDFTYEQICNDGSIEKSNENPAIIALEDGVIEHNIQFNRYRVDYADGKKTRLNELILEMSVDLNNNRYEVKDTRIDIKYCPFCGEEL